jgi:hypothetical protein
VHFSRSLPSNSWWQTMDGCQVLSRPSAAEAGAAGQPLQDLPPSHTRPPRSTAGNSSAGCLKTGPQYRRNCCLIENVPVASCCSPRNSPFFCSTAPQAFFRPDRRYVRPPRAAAVNDGPSWGRPKGLSLTAASTVATSSGSGRGSAQGAACWPALLASADVLKMSSCAICPRHILSRRCRVRSWPSEYEPGYRAWRRCSN